MFTKFHPWGCARSITKLIEANEEEWDRLDAKDCWVATGELAAFLDARQALESAGYRIRYAEILEDHPIWFFDLDRSNAPRIRNGNKLLHHVRDVMWKAHIHYHDDDVMLQPGRHHQLILSIAWRIPARGERRAAAWESWRFEELLDRLP